MLWTSSTRSGLTRMGLELALALERQKVYKDLKRIKHFVLDDKVMQELSTEDISGTPVKPGNENKIVAKDGTEYELNVAI